MRISFRRDVLANYMVIENVEGFREEDFAVKMQEYNRIKNLLAFSYEIINGRVNFLYNISSKQAMLTLLEAEKVTYETLCGFVASLKSLVDTLEEYLLDMNNIMLKKECIFFDMKSGKYRYCYNPYYNGDLKMEIRVIFDELLSAIDYEDPKSVKLAYILNRECHRENFTVESLISVIEEETAVREEKKQNVKEPVRQDINPEKPGPSSDNRRDIKPEKREDIDDIDIFDGIWEPAPAPVLKKADEEPAPGLIRKISGYMNGKSVYDIAEDIDSGQIKSKIKETAPLPEVRESRTKEHSGRKKRDKKSDKYDYKAMAFNDRSEYQTEKKTKNEDELLFEEIRLNLSELCDDDAPTADSAADGCTDKRKLVGINRQQGQVIELDTYPFTIGKLKDRVNRACQSPAVSRLHCRIYENASSGEGYFFEDLNSKNGSYINNKRVNPYSRIPLHEGDIIKIADEEYAFT